MEEEFGLSDLDEKLVERRIGETGQPSSLRDLTEFFNQAVLETALEEAGMDPLEGEAANVYRLLTDDDVTNGTEVRTRRRLERKGVDLENVEGSFVSHPTIGNHLRDCLGVESPERSKSPLETAEERVFKMQTRAERVVENTLEGLSSAEHLAGGTLAVTVDLQVTCEECGVHKGVAAFIEEGGCDCERPLDE